ncbi:MAG: carboxypeptidase-like regulatory domain-containing protein, partial [Bacteroidota bacterium]|nr:carboxypeptidase-like regulatory domain-containing protein [Bacteroidota bacterium]
MEKKLKMIIHWRFSPGMKKTMLYMKLTTVFLLAIVLQSFAGMSYSQNTTLSISLKNASVQTVMQQIEDQSDFYFLYSRTVIDVDRSVDIQVKNAKIADVLSVLFNDTDVAYKVDGRQIVLSKKLDASFSEIQQPKSVSGKVTDSSGGSLPGASVVVKGTTNGTITDSNGSYSLSNVPDNATLQFSFVGMKMQEIVVGGKTMINVTLEEETIGIEEVVAIG